MNKCCSYGPRFYLLLGSIKFNSVRLSFAFFFLFLGPCSVGHLRGPTRCQGRDCSYELQTHPTTSPDRCDNQSFLNRSLSLFYMINDDDSYSSQTIFSSTLCLLSELSEHFCSLAIQCCKSLCCIYGGLLFFQS